MKIFTMMLIVVIFYGCSYPSGKRTKKEGYSVIIIDSCEYIEVSSMVGASQGVYSLTHKGNCEFCKDRKN